MSKIKLRASLALLLAALAILCSCSSGNTTVIATAKGSGIIEYKTTGDGSSGSDVPVTEGAVVNKNTKVIHVSLECSSVKKMSESNKLYIEPEEISSYIEEGYKICSVCGKDYNK